MTAIVLQMWPGMLCASIVLHLQGRTAQWTCCCTVFPADVCICSCPNACADLGDPSINANAPSSAEKGAGSIAWNVEHKQPEEINGGVWQFGQELGF